MIKTWYNTIFNSRCLNHTAPQGQDQNSQNNCNFKDIHSTRIFIRLQLDLDPNNLKTGVSLAHPSLTDWIILLCHHANSRISRKQIGRWSFASWQIWPNMICGLQIPSIFISSRLSTQLSSGNPCISRKIENIGWTNQTCEVPPGNNILKKSEQEWLGRICRHKCNQSKTPSGSPTSSWITPSFDTSSFHTSSTNYF